MSLTDRIARGPRAVTSTRAAIHVPVVERVVVGESPHGRTVVREPVVPRPRWLDRMSKDLTPWTGEGR